MNLVDCIYTARAIQLGGEEANPFMNWVLQYHGMRGIFISKISLLACLGLLLWHLHLERHTYLRRFFYIAVLVYSALTLYHYMWYLMEKGAFMWL